MDFAAVIYLVIILILIYKTNFFGVFKSEHLSPRLLTVTFFLKCLAVPVFIVVYKNLYGGLEKFDAGIFYNDAKELHHLASVNFTEFLKAMVGMQDDSPGSYFYNHYIVYTNNWDNGRIRDLFYNDNRIVIRVHALLHFFPFASYAVHAVMNCFLSFAGLFYLHKTFAVSFEGKEKLFLTVICFFPSLWFYTGAVLKEGIVIMVLGCTGFLVLKTITVKFRVGHIIVLVFLLFTSALLKPYYLYPVLFCFFLYFLISARSVKYKTLVFFVTIGFSLYLSNLVIYRLSDQTLPSIALERQQAFANASKGGLFLENNFRLLRLDLDTTLISRRSSADGYRIKKDAPYMYWEHSHQQDTLFCQANTDTVTVYQFVDMVETGGSNIDVQNYSDNNAAMMFKAFYYALLYPLFWNANGPLQWIASFENLLLVLAMFVFLANIFNKKRQHFLPVIFMFLALSLSILTGITTPNTGAIFRYRSVAVIFILLSALYYIRPIWIKNFKRQD